MLLKTVSIIYFAWLQFIIIFIIGDRWCGLQAVQKISDPKSLHWTYFASSQYSTYIFICIGDWWCCVQAVQDPRGAQVHRSRPHRDASEAEGEPPQALQEQEVQAAGPEAQEDPRYPQGAYRPREEPEDR